MSDTVLDRLGDEAGIAALVDRFYHHMDTRKDAKQIRAMHPPDLSTSNDKLYCFLVQRFGGRPLFSEKYGAPMLRARHMPFPIGDEDAIAWVTCMDLALAEQVKDPAFRTELLAFFSQVAEFMVNKKG